MFRLGLRRKPRPFGAWPSMLCCWLGGLLAQSVLPGDMRHTRTHAHTHTCVYTCTLTWCANTCTHIYIYNESLPSSGVRSRIRLPGLHIYEILLNPPKKEKCSCPGAEFRGLKLRSGKIRILKDLIVTSLGSGAYTKLYWDIGTCNKNI